MKCRKKRCGWCRRKLSKNRTESDVPIGTECDKKLPDELKVAFLNMAQHSYHGGFGTNRDDELTKIQKTIDEQLGSKAELIFACEPFFADHCDEWRVNAYYNNNGKAIHIHHLDGNQDIPLGGEDRQHPDQEETPYYTKDGLLWKRRIALMLNPISETKVKVTHCDPWWLYFVQGGNEYYGPIDADLSPNDWALARGATAPVALCTCGEFGDGFEIELLKKEVSDLEELESMPSPSSDKGGGGLLRLMIQLAWDQAIGEISAHEAAFEDITNHSMYIEGSMFGDFTDYTKRKLDPTIDHDGTKRDKLFADKQWKADFNNHWKSDDAQDVFREIIIPLVTRGIGEGFNEEWEWQHGTVTTDFELPNNFTIPLNTWQNLEKLQ